MGCARGGGGGAAGPGDLVHVAMQRRVAAQTERFNVFPQPDKLIGIAVQRQVFREPDLLPVYGSSELTQPQWNRADEFFGNHPSGLRRVSHRQPR